MAAVLEPTLTRDEAPTSSDKSFGYVFAAVFAILGAWPLIHAQTPRWWMFAVAVAFALVAIVRPQILRPLNRLWYQFGLLLHRVMSPLVMTAIFFLCVTPLAVLMRMLGKDVLMLKRRPDLSSYWIASDAPPSAKSLRRQF